MIKINEWKKTNLIANCSFDLKEEPQHKPNFDIQDYFL